MFEIISMVILREAFKVVLLLAVYYFAGCLVYHKNVKVNYTRKIGHFAWFFVPAFFTYFFPYQNSGLNDLSGIISFGLYMLTYLFFIKPIRKRVPIFQRMFLSLDRVEDRPFTLRWLFLQLLISSIIMTMLNFPFRYFGYGALMVMISPLSLIGDGLAEPVGVRFGRLHYKAYALFTKKRYTRTIEGSATIVVVNIIVLLLFRNLFTPQQLTVALLTIPILTAVAEAISPHTMDTPFLFLTTGGGLFLIKHFL